MNELEKLSKLQ